MPVPLELEDAIEDAVFEQIAQEDIATFARRPALRAHGGHGLATT